MSQSALSACWHGCTRDSKIVDIRQIRSTEELAKYVTKYVTKPASASVYKDPDLLQEAILAMHGRRTLISFGTWYGVNFLARPDAKDWKPIAPLDELIERAERNDPVAMRIVAQLQGALECQTKDRSPPHGMDLFDSSSNRSAQSAADRCT